MQKESGKTEQDTDQPVPLGNRSNGSSGKRSRVPVLKTYKLYIDGKFPRSESGRYIIQQDADGKPVANICRASRKDFRDAVSAARKAQESWSARSAFNKGQILYRIAEVLEGRKAQFEAELMLAGLDKEAARYDAGLAVDRLVYYAGWCDKYQQVFSSVNPVESSHFNFSIAEPMGVICALAPGDRTLSGLISVIAPAIAGGNTVVALASELSPLAAITFGEVLQTSDVPAGVVNLLTGYRSELTTHFSSHMDVNAMVYTGNDADEIALIRRNAAMNVKRIADYSGKDFTNPQMQDPYFIMDLQEIKTTWHPIGQ